MTMRPKGPSLRSRWLPTCGFVRLTCVWFAGLLGLYGVYAVIAFFRLAPRIPDTYRAIMVLGPGTMALAVLVGAATFAGSVMRFDQLTTRDSVRRRIYWGQLVLFGLGAYLLARFGSTTIRAMLPGAADLPPDAFAPFVGDLADLRRLVPVPIALFAVVSGVTGSLVGRVTSRSVRPLAGALPWLVCCALVGAFTASLLATVGLIVHSGLPPIWVGFAPLTVPLVALAVLLWRERSRFSPLTTFRGTRTGSDSAELEAVDEIPSDTKESRRGEEHRGAAAEGSPEDDIARVAQAIRRAAGSRARMSDAQVSDIVRHLVQQGEVRTRPAVGTHTNPVAGIGEFCSAWMSFAGGYLMVGLVGGVFPSVLSAVVVGLIGSVPVLSAVRDQLALAGGPWSRG